MNLFETGQVIAQLRKEAGYTQKSLAEALFITDKAVSKWERGLCLPDSSLLTKLSMLLDADIEYLIAGNTPYGEHRWVGELRLQNVRGEVAGKPLLHYMLSYFMLIGITDVAILTDDTDYVEGLELQKYGLNIAYKSFQSDRTMLIYDRFLLFGVNITRQFQHCMAGKQTVSVTLQGKKIPILFGQGYLAGRNVEDMCMRAGIKALGRGTVFIPLNTESEIADADALIRIYEKYHDSKIADLDEIAVARGLV